MMKHRTHLIAALLAFAAWAPLWVAHAQPAAPAPAAPDYSSTSGVIPWSAIMEKPSAGNTNTANTGSASAAGTAATDAVKGDGKPIHEELSRSNLQEAIKEFNAGEGGIKKPESDSPAAGANPLRNPLSSAAKAAQAQANRAEWANVSQYDRVIDDLLPWAWITTILLLLGLAFKLWLNYMKAKAARPGMRRRAARKRSHRSSSHSAAAASAEPPDSQAEVSTLRGAMGQDSESGSRESRSSGSSSRSSSGRSSGTSSGRSSSRLSGRSSSSSSSAPSGTSDRQRHRSPRSQL
jgi:hypothetical protein